MNTEDSEFARIEREQAMRGVPDAIHHTDTSEPLMYIQGWNDCRQAMLEQPAQVEVCCGDYGKCMKPCTPRGKWLAEQPAQQEPDKHQEYIDSLSHDHDSEEKMLTQIHHWARQSYSRHQQSVRGQAITAADSSDNHIIWAALRWAKENPSPQAQPAQRKPLTEFEFEVLHRKAKGFVQTGLMDVVHMVEHHHNIKESQS